MTKKHFEALANALAKARPEIQTYDWLDCVSAIADVCKATNPRFDRQQFIEACETR